MIEIQYDGFLKPWLRQIVEEHQKGKTPVEIAKYLVPAVKELYNDSHSSYYPPYYSTIESSVRYVLKRMGLYKPNDNTKRKERVSRILYLRQQGYTYADIAAELGITPSRIQQLAIKAKEQQEKYDAARLWGEKVDEYFSRPLKGRPLDMGGPRDVWIEKGPWDEI